MRKKSLHLKTLGYSSHLINFRFHKFPVCDASKIQGAIEWSVLPTKVNFKWIRGSVIQMTNIFWSTMTIIKNHSCLIECRIINPFLRTHFLFYLQHQSSFEKFWFLKISSNKKFFSSFENTLLPVFVFVWYLRLKLQFKYIFLFWHFPDISSSATINIIIAGILILQRQNFRKAQKTQKYVKSNVKAYSEFIPHWVLNGLQSY